MNAMLIRRYGGPEVFEFGEIQNPVPDDDEIMVRVKGSCVNPVDCAMRQGMLKAFIPLRLPAILGVDFSGEVVSVGKSTTLFKYGDLVYGFSDLKNPGAYGEFLCVKEFKAAPVPVNIPMYEAATVPGVGLTALEAFKDIVPLKIGMEVLIVGATGGVGSYAIQIARLMEARVTAVCSTGNMDLARELGADTVIDYTSGSILDLSGRYDVILNCHRGTSDLSLRKLLKKNGRLIIIAGNFFNMPVIYFLNMISSRKTKSFYVSPSGKNLLLLTRWIEEKRVRVLIDRVYSWKDLAEAHRHVERGKIKGKVAIQMD